MDKKELEKAFLNTKYTILKNNILKEGITIKIGEVIDFSSVLPDLTEWAFITAWNPLPEICSYEENKKRNSILANDLMNDGS